MRSARVICAHRDSSGYWDRARARARVTLVLGGFIDGARVNGVVRARDISVSRTNMLKSDRSEDDAPDAGNNLREAPRARIVRKR